jgi:Rieske Fe-S protein
VFPFRESDCGDKELDYYAFSKICTHPGCPVVLYDSKNGVFRSAGDFIEPVDPAV